MRGQTTESLRSSTQVPRVLLSPGAVYASVEGYWTSVSRLFPRECRRDCFIKTVHWFRTVL